MRPTAIDATLTQGERVFALATPDREPMPKDEETRMGVWSDGTCWFKVDHVTGQVLLDVEIDPNSGNMIVREG